jgi:hypothetical protein
MPVSSTSKNILFISTMTGSPWGGSEVLWYLTALKALKEGHEVSIYYKYWGDQESHHLSNLRSLGAEIRYYGQPKEDQLPVSFLDKLRHLINRNSAFEIRKKERKDTREEPAGDHFYGVDVVCVSQGTTYDIVNRSDIRELIESLQKPYIFNRSIQLRLRIFHCRCQRLSWEKKSLERLSKWFLSQKPTKYLLSTSCSKISPKKLMS